MDNFFSGQKLHKVAGIAAGLGCVLMVIFPENALLSAQKGISLWAGSVFPALLPFFICVNFMHLTGITRYLPPQLFTFCMSIMSGYPMGAKIIGDMKRGGVIDRQESMRLLSFCSTSGPSFMVGAIGAGMLGSAGAGAVIAVAHYGGAIINGVIFSAILKMYYGGKKCVRKATVPLRDAVPIDKSIPDVLTDAIFASLKALGIILAYIIIFMFVTDMPDMFGWPANEGNLAISATLRGIVEMTVGCSALAGCMSITSELRCIICTGLISFGGMSVAGQTMSMLLDTGINLGYYLVVKVFHGMISMVLAYIILHFFILL